MSKIKEFEFKNVRSYGNKITKIPFDLENGLVLIEGKNGFGKTSICEALEYAIYGKSSRVASKVLPNWFNSNMYTNITFETDDNRTIKLVRGVSPDFYQMTIDEICNVDSKDKKNENVSSKVILDKMVENELFNIPFDVFANNILLSIHDFKSFVNMKAADKRKIIDKIFDTDIFNSMLKTVKDEIKGLKDDTTFLKSVIETKKETLEKTLTRISELSSMDTSERDKEIQELNDTINYLKNSISEASNKKDKLTEESIALSKEYSEYVSKLNGLKKSILNDYTNAVLSIDEKYNSLLNNKKDDINSRKNKFYLDTEEQFKSNIQLLVKPEDAISDKINELNKSIELLNESFTLESNKINKEKDDNYNLLCSKYDSELESTKSAYESKINELSSRIKDNKDKLSQADIIDKKISGDKIKDESILSNLNNNLNLYNQSKCPTCGGDLTDSYHQDKKAKLQLEIEKISNHYSSLEKTMNSVSEKVNEIKSIIESDESALKSINSELNAYMIETNNKKNSDITNSINEYNSKINDLSSEAKRKIAVIEENKNNILSIESARYNSEYNSIVNKKNESISLFVSEIEKELNEFTVDNEKKRSTEKTSQKIIFDSKNHEVEEKSYSKIEEFKKTAENNSSSINSLTEVINSNTEKLNSSTIRLNEISVSDVDSALKELNSLVSSLNFDLTKLTSEYDEKMNLLSIKEDAGYLIGDDGLKKVIMRNILPSFNETINEITTLFGFKYRFVFDDDFNVHMSYCGNPVPVSTSRGEEKIMDIIVLLSTLQLILMKHPTLNILFLDEIFSNLDVENIAKAVSILKGYSEKYNLTIFVMSHTTVPQEMFSRIIEVKNDGMFSEIQIK